MNKRRERIDYKILHNSGLKVLKSSESNTSVSSSSDSLSDSDSSVNTLTDIQPNTETLKEVLELPHFETILIKDEKENTSIHSVKMTTPEEIKAIVKDVSVAQQTIADDIDDYME